MPSKSTCPASLHTCRHCTGTVSSAVMHMDSTDTATVQIHTSPSPSTRSGQCTGTAHLARIPQDTRSASWHTPCLHTAPCRSDSRSAAGTATDPPHKTGLHTDRAWIQDTPGQQSTCWTAWHTTDLHTRSDCSSDTQPCSDTPPRLQRTTGPGTAQACPRDTMSMHCTGPHSMHSCRRDTAQVCSSTATRHTHWCLTDHTQSSCRGTCLRSWHSARPSTGTACPADTLWAPASRTAPASTHRAPWHTAPACLTGSHCRVRTCSETPRSCHRRTAQAQRQGMCCSHLRTTHGMSRPHSAMCPSGTAEQQDTTTACLRTTRRRTGSAWHSHSSR
eukprot:comp22522_c0_seq3/m.56612 comp22522_c0_seq3/g.56612  ORF comp22522_c0_seq3/g.56612 comp22522_c0_seq3/m.56612 type:complete len:332 (+) comp22522_c0_seq3:806-1801(+)